MSTRNQPNYKEETAKARLVQNRTVCSLNDGLSLHREACRLEPYLQAVGTNKIIWWKLNVELNKQMAFEIWVTAQRHAFIFDDQR